MIEIRISQVSDAHSDALFGASPVVIKYKAPGSKKWENRYAFDDKASTRAMLNRMVDEVMRKADFQEGPADKIRRYMEERGTIESVQQKSAAEQADDAREEKL